MLKLQIFCIAKNPHKMQSHITLPCSSFFLKLLRSLGASLRTMASASHMFWEWDTPLYLTKYTLLPSSVSCRQCASENDNDTFEPLSTTKRSHVDTRNIFIYFYLVYVVFSFTDAAFIFFYIPNRLYTLWNRMHSKSNPLISTIRTIPIIWGYILQRRIQTSYVKCYFTILPVTTSALCFQSVCSWTTITPI